MKTMLLLLSCYLAVIAVEAPAIGDLNGAWSRNQDGNQQTLVFADGYWSFVEFNIQDREFIGTMGGSCELNGSSFEYVLEYNTLNNDSNYQPLDGAVTHASNELKIGNTEWNRVDDGTPGKLAGAWLITGRERDGVITTRTPGDRKTMKILSGTRFQWIAYNSASMEFMGTGGGSYTTEDGKYVENIEFFSRDSTRVGASLEFDFQLINGDWHHQGKSSKGEPIYEVWSLR